MSLESCRKGICPIRHHHARVWNTVGRYESDREGDPTDLGVGLSLRGQDGQSDQDVGLMLGITCSFELKPGGVAAVKGQMSSFGDIRVPLVALIE